MALRSWTVLTGFYLTSALMQIGVVGSNDDNTGARRVLE